MKVVAIKTAFYDNHFVNLGDELDIPKGTKGTWFAPVDSEEAGIAKEIKSYKCTTPPTFGFREATPDHLRRYLAELRGSENGRKETTFNELMRGNQRRNEKSFHDLMHPQQK